MYNHVYARCCTCVREHSMKHVLNKKGRPRCYAKTLTAQDPFQLCTMYVYALYYLTSDLKKLTVKCTTYDATCRVVWGSSALLTV